MFGFLKKKTEPQKACACSCAEETVCGCGCEKKCVCDRGCAEGNAGAVKSIRVLGANGCGTCHTLLRRVEEVTQELGINPEIEFIGDIKRVIGYGIMGMPGLVVNENVVSSGKLLSNEQIKKILLETK